MALKRRRLYSETDKDNMADQLIEKVADKAAVIVEIALISLLSTYSSLLVKRSDGACEIEKLKNFAAASLPAQHKHCKCRYQPMPFALPAVPCETYTYPK